MRLPLTVLLIALTVGCHSVAAPVPGSANAFDSDSYLTLVATHSVIESTKTDLAANSFPMAIAGNVKTALNLLITAYDTANQAYLAYHTAALAGTSTAAQQTAVTNALTNVQTATTTLTAAKGGS